MSERESGLDLIRCLALLFVVTFHSFLYNGYYYELQSGILMWLAGSFRWLSVSCIGLFLMLTGYLKSDRTDIKACWRGLAPIILGYLLAAAISVPVRHFVFGDLQSFSTWCNRLFSFSAVYYGWYVEMYIGLLLLMPFINMALGQIKTTKGLLTIAGVMLFLTALPGATAKIIAPDYWRGLFPLTYYILGAVVKRLQREIKPYIGILGALLMSFALGTATVLSTDRNLGEAMTWEFADLWIAVIAVCLFTSFYSLRIPSFISKLLCFGAKGCYGGYLLSYLLDAWLYKLVPNWRTPEKYLLFFIGITVPTFLVSLLCGRALQEISARLLRAVERIISKLKLKLGYATKND